VSSQFVLTCRCLSMRSKCGYFSNSLYGIMTPVKPCMSLRSRRIESRKIRQKGAVRLPYDTPKLTESSGRRGSGRFEALPTRAECHLGTPNTTLTLTARDVNKAKTKEKVSEPRPNPRSRPHTYKAKAKVSSQGKGQGQLAKAKANAKATDIQGQGQGQSQCQRAKAKSKAKAKVSSQGQGQGH